MDIMLLKNDFFGFPKVKWLYYTDEVGKCTSFDVKFSQDLTHQKSLKSVYFWQSYSKSKKVDVFGTVYFSFQLRHVNQAIACNFTKYLPILIFFTSKHNEKTVAKHNNHTLNV